MFVNCVWLLFRQSTSQMTHTRTIHIMQLRHPRHPTHHFLPKVVYTIQLPQSQSHHAITSSYTPDTSLFTKSGIHYYTVTTKPFQRTILSCIFYSLNIKSYIENMCAVRLYDCIHVILWWLYTCFMFVCACLQ